MALKTYVLAGKAGYAKIVGPAPAGYENGPNEWTFDLILDEENKTKALKDGVDPFYIRVNKSGEDYIKFTRKEKKQDGEAAKPIEIQDHKGELWDGKTLIGNGSDLRVQFTLNTVKSKGTQRNKPSVLRVQVWTLVKYAKKVFDTREDGPEEAVAEW